MINKFWNKGLGLAVRVIACVSVATAMVIAPNYARATLVTFDFSGTITSLGRQLESTFSIGSAFNGSFTYDTATAGTSSEPNQVQYLGAISAATITFEGNTYTATTGAINVLDDHIAIGHPPQDFINFEAHFVSGPSVTGSEGGLAVQLDPALFVVGLFDSTATALSSLNIPTSPPDLTLFTNRDMSFTFTWMGLPSHVRGTVLTLTAAVPEPATLALVTIGLAGLGFSRRKRTLTYPRWG